MKTLQIVGDSAYGGAGYLLVRWCEYLIQRGHSVDVISTEPSLTKEIASIEKCRVLTDIRIPREILPIQDAVALVRLVKLLVSGQYDVVHTYTSTPGFVGRLAARLVRVPVIVHHQAGWVVNEFSPIWQRMAFLPLEYLATVMSTKSICVSRAIYAEGVASLHLPVSRLVTICNGIEAAPFARAAETVDVARARSSLGLGVNDFVIGNTGRLAEQKDNASLLRAAAMANEQGGRRVFVLLVGTGPEIDRLKSLAAELRITENVIFMGFRRDVPDILPLMDVFASPTWREGLSISLLEAMASARPIVATDIPSNAEVIDHERTGLLVPIRDPAALSAALLRFMNNRHLAERCASAAQATVKTLYSLERMFRETLSLYEDLRMKEYPFRTS